MESVWLDEEQLRNRYWDSMKGKLKKEIYNWKFNKLLGSCRAESSSTVCILFTAIDKYKFSKFSHVVHVFFEWLQAFESPWPLIQANAAYFMGCLLSEMEDTKSVENYLPQVWGIHDVTCTGLGSIALRVSRVFALGCCSWCCTSLREKDGSSTKSF
jgi:hypothetical protein